MGDQEFIAGIVYDVDYPTANYLVNHQQVAELVSEVDTIQPEKPKTEPITQNLQTDKPSEILKIAIVRIGGIGDSLVTGGFAVAVKRKYPNSEITIYIRDKDSMEILQDNPSVDHIVMVGNKVIADLVEKVIMKRGFDIVYDVRYMTKTYYSDPERFKDDKIKTDEAFKPYEEYFNAYPLRNNELWHKYQISSYDFMLKTTCLEGSPDDLFIYISEQDKNMLALLEGDKYVTVHNGTDIARQTKSWPIEHWKMLVKYLKRRGYKVIQIGRHLEEPIEGAIVLNGKANLKQSSAVMSKAQFHIDTESGNAHIARAMGVRSIVLFGPTNIDFFKYDININILTQNKCKDCWWKNDMWWRECPEKHPLPVPCMKDITPEIVLEAVKEIEKLEKYEKKIIEKEIEKPVEKIKSPFYDSEYYKQNQQDLERMIAIGAKIIGDKILIINAGKHALVLAERLKERKLVISCVEKDEILRKSLELSGYICYEALPAGKRFDTIIYDDAIISDSLLTEIGHSLEDNGKMIFTVEFGEGFSMILKDGKYDYIIMEGQNEKP